MKVSNPKHPSCEEDTNQILLPWKPNSENRRLVEKVCLVMQASSQVRTKEHYDLGHELVLSRPVDYAGYKLIFQCVQSGVVDPQSELDRSAAVAKASSKNFQIWPHRYAVMQLLSTEDRQQYYESRERSFVHSILSMDKKNYHVWNYKMSLLNLLNNLNWEEELRWVEQLMEDDLLNNSYWTYRFICMRHLLTSGVMTYKDELSYVNNALSKTPANQSIWDYVKGLYDWLIIDGLNTSTGQEDDMQRSQLAELYKLVYQYTTTPTIVPAGLYLRILLLPLHPDDAEELKTTLDQLSISKPATCMWTLMANLCTRMYSKN